MLLKTIRSGSKSYISTISNGKQQQLLLLSSSSISNNNNRRLLSSSSSLIKKPSSLLFNNHNNHYTGGANSILRSFHINSNTSSTNNTNTPTTPKQSTSPSSSDQQQDQQQPESNTSATTSTNTTQSTNDKQSTTSSTTSTTTTNISLIKEKIQSIINKRLNKEQLKSLKSSYQEEYQEWKGKTRTLLDQVLHFYENLKYKLSYYGKFYFYGFKQIGQDTKKYLQLKKEINNNRPFHLANRSEIYFTTQYSIELLKAIPFIVLFFPFSTIYFAVAFIFPILLPTQLVLPRKKVKILNNINKLRNEQSKLIINRLIQFTNLVNNRYIVVDEELMEECNRFTILLQNVNKNTPTIGNNSNNSIGNSTVSNNGNGSTHLERVKYIKYILNELKELNDTKFVNQFLKFNFMSTTLLDDICRFSLIGRSHLGGISGAIKEDNTSAIYGLRKYDPNILQQLLMNFFDVLASDEFVQAITPNLVKMHQLNRFINQLREDDKFIQMDDQVSNVLGVKEETSLREWLKICYVRSLYSDPTCYGGVNTVLKSLDDLIMAGEHAPLTSTNTLLNVTAEESQQLIDELRELHSVWHDFTKDIKSNELLIVACILLK